MARGNSCAISLATRTDSATASVPIANRESAGSPILSAWSTYFFKPSSACSRTRSTSSTPWKVALSTTPTVTKRTFWK